MSIEVSGGGSLAVTTEALLTAERVLGRAGLRAQGARASATRVARLTLPVVPWAAAALGLAAHELGELGDEARRLAADLRVASEAYGLAERVELARQELLSRALGPFAAIALSVTSLAVASALRGPRAVDDVDLVAALRRVADSVDLRLLLMAGRAMPGSALEETPVRAVQVGRVPGRAPAPSGFAELAERIPGAERDAPQVRVERYALPSGAVHWVVYVAGTSDWSVTPGADPWDDTSNVVGLAGGSAGATRATLAALTEAGWRQGEPVLPVGHSQGGMVAGALAAGGVAPVPMLVTFGSPSARVAVPGGTVDVAVEHAGDPVPALGGSPRLVDKRLVVRGAAPAAPAAEVLPAHAMSGYVQTARELDTSTDDRVRGARVTLAEFTGGQRAEVTMWLGEREQAPRLGR